MKRTLVVAGELAVNERPDYRSIVLDITEDLIPGWCLELCLLSQRLTEQLEVRGDRGPFTLRMQLNPRLRTPRGEVTWSAKGAELSLTGEELEGWLHFFLKCYRDGQGEVDHIDVELTSPNPADAKALFLTLRVPKAAPPLSEEEMRRRLGLNRTDGAKDRRRR